MMASLVVIPLQLQHERLELSNVAVKAYWVVAKWRSYSNKTVLFLILFSKKGVTERVVIESKLMIDLDESFRE